MFWNRLFTKRTPSAPTPAPADVPYACAELDALPLPFSPLVGETMRMYCHSRSVGALSQAEHCPDEYRMVARSLIHHLLEGWQNQTSGQGTIDDLLLQPRESRTTGTPATRTAEHSAPGEHGLAS